MFAVRDSKRISIGKDFVSAVANTPVWKVNAAGFYFEVCFECTGDEACEAVKQTLASEGRSVSSYQFQRA